MNNKIPLIIEKEAKKIKCPFIMDKHGYPARCYTNECMAWITVQEKTSREDHSRGKEYMAKVASAYGVTMYREGPHGSEGLWSIDSLGYCRRLWSIGNITKADYLRELL